MHEYAKSSRATAEQDFEADSPDGVHVHGIGPERVTPRPRAGARRVVGSGGRGLERSGARRASRPRPVRPEAVAVVVRPPQPERPQVVEQSRCAAPARQRLLARPAAPSRTVLRVRRALAGVTVTVLAAAVVAGLGLLADAAAEQRGGGAEAAPAVVSVVGPVAYPLTVRVETPGTVWDLARRLAPGARGPEVAAVAERIASANSLTSVDVRPGQVLVVPRG